MHMFPLLAAALLMTSVAAFPATAQPSKGKPIQGKSPEQIQESMKKSQEQWDKMTPEQKAAFRAKRAAEFRSRLQRKGPQQQQQPKFEQYYGGKPTGPAGNVPVNPAKDGVGQSGTTLGKKSELEKAKAKKAEGENAPMAPEGQPVP